MGSSGIKGEGLDGQVVKHFLVLGTTKSFKKIIKIFTVNI
jgi:hypothetical protein